VLRQLNRLTWDFAPEVRDSIKTLQQQAQRDGRAQPLTSRYLCLLNNDTNNPQESVLDNNHRQK
jgi:hypothetical protein